MFSFRRRAGTSRVPAKLEAELRAEIRFYLEMRTRQLIAEGADPADAERTAERVFGDADSIIEECVAIDLDRHHRKRRREILERIAEDVRYVVRSLFASPAFSAITILTLAIGIGANTAIFSVVSAVLLEPLPYDEADRLVAIESPRPPGEPRRPDRGVEDRVSST